MLDGRGDRARRAGAGGERGESTCGRQGGSLAVAFRSSQLLLQLRVLGPGFFQDGDVGMHSAPFQVGRRIFFRNAA